jgi:preprotein translocase subunit SecA
MTTDSKLVSPWEYFTDALGAFSEGVVNFLGRLFGSSNERQIRALGYLPSRDPSANHIVTPGSLLAQVNDLEETMKAKSDAELKGMTAHFRERLAAGETLEDLLPEAFAACREAGRRTKNMRHFDVQIVGGVVLHRGNIAEMVTGEGKTLVATLPAFLNGLEGQGVHIVTVNDYLARRDCEWMLPIYRAVGMEAGFIQSDMDPLARRKAYDCDITYGTNSEFGFDYLRDNMKPARWADDNYDPHFQQVQKALHYAIIDEVDNILVDEARTPLIISGPAFGDLSRYARANQIAVQLSELQKQDKSAPAPADGEDEEAAKKRESGRFFEVKEKERTCHLTDEGIRKAEELAGVESFYTAGNMEWPHLIDNALKAHHLYTKDRQYLIMRDPEPPHDMAIIIVDEFTGRPMFGRQWSDGLHQAVQAKHAREGVKIKEETQTLATITLQNYFKLYDKLAGMTGTAMTEANEFWKVYKLDVIAIPTNKPLVRVNHADMIYMSEKEKWDAVVEEVERVHKFDVLKLNDGTELVGGIRKESESELELLLRDNNEKRKVTADQIESLQRRGRPMLIGTTDVDKSEKLSAMLKRRGIRHELLNAKPEFAHKEAEIVAQAGRIGGVTIATNMAGRGTDIILGGNPETLAWARLKDKYPTRLDVPEAEWKALVEKIETDEKMKEEGRVVATMGGLHIIGTERHEARRIDNQLRGRAGRQGDPGSSRFYLSLEDDLMRIFAGEWVKNILTRLGMEEGQAIESRMVSRRIEAAQKKVEERNFDIRKNLLEYDEVMDHQRKKVYGYRQEILDGGNCKIRVLKMIENQIDLALDRFLADDYGAATFAEFAAKRLGVEFDAADFARSDFTEADRTSRDKANRMVQTQIFEAIEENLSTDVDPKEWNWQAMANAMNTRYGLKLNDRQLKQIGRDNLSQYLIAEGEKSLAAVDLSGGEPYLKPDWGIRSVVDWARLKFQIKLDAGQLAEKQAAEIKEMVLAQIKTLYHQKEIEFPVQLGMARFMSDRPHPAHAHAGGHRYDREGLMLWVKQRFPGAAMTEEDFRTLPRSKIQEKLREVSQKSFPAATHDDIDAKLDESLAGTEAADADDAKELADWFRTTFNVELDVEHLEGLSHEDAREYLWDAYDVSFRREMRRMERSLLLNQLDSAWKNHLYTMDHLRSTVGLRSYAQEDPKIVYKREGMKEFDAMWEGVEDKVSDLVFRMEEEEGFQETLWSIGSTIHESAPKVEFQPSEQSIEGQQQAAITNSQKSEKKKEPIRNRAEKVGRNEPCPCGSGKKYKVCCMRKVMK